MDGVVGTIVSGLVLGIIIGPLARLVLPGKQNISIPMTILFGALGAIAGGLIYTALGGTETEGVDWIELAVQVAVAAVAVVIYGNMADRRTT